MQERIEAIIQKFREKGAVSPEKALGLQELGLPPRFEQAMRRRLGQIGIFGEVSGKYYLNEERLKQIQQQRTGWASGSGFNRQEVPGWLRYGGILLMFPLGIIAVGLLVLYFDVFGGTGYFPGEIIIILLVVLVILFLVRILFWRARRQHMRQRWMQNKTA